MGVIRIVDMHGDTAVEWDVADEKSVEKARELFRHKRLEGYFAYAVAPGIALPGAATTQKKGTMLTAFDPKEGTIVMTPPLQGG